MGDVGEIHGRSMGDRTASLPEGTPSIGHRLCRGLGWVRERVRVRVRVRVRARVRDRDRDRARARARVGSRSRGRGRA